MKQLISLLTLGLLLASTTLFAQDSKPKTYEAGKSEAEKKEEPPPKPAGAGERRERMSPIRQRIAERLLASQKNTATLTTFNEADMSAVMALRARYKESFQKKYGVNLGLMSFFVKASIEALRAFPIVRAGPAHVATLKTFDPPLATLEGRRLAGARRRAKRLLFPTEDGELVLLVHLMTAGRLRYLRAGDKVEVLGTNELAEDDMCMATPAIAGDRLIIRSAARVYL